MSSQGKIVVSARIDVRTLAQVAKFMARKGDSPRNRAHIVRSASRIVSEAAMQDNLIDEVETVTKAIDILEGFGITFEANKKNASEVAQALSLESINEAAEDDSQTLEEIIEERAKKEEGSSDDDSPASPSDILSD